MAEYKPSKKLPEDIVPPKHSKGEWELPSGYKRPDFLTEGVLGRITDSLLNAFNPRLYQPLPRIYWFCSLLMLGTIFFTYSIIIGDLTREATLSDLEVNVVTLLENPAQQQNRTGGVFLSIYRGTQFNKPHRFGFYEGDFTFRTDHELADWVDSPPQSAVFAGKLRVPRPGNYEFFIDAKAGARIYINNETVFDKWDTVSIRESAGHYELPAGWVPIYVEWHNPRDNGWLGIWWRGPDVPMQFLPAAALAPDPKVGPPR